MQKNKRTIIIIVCVVLAIIAAVCFLCPKTVYAPEPEVEPSESYNEADYQFPEIEPIAQGFVENPDDIDGDGLSNEDEAKYNTNEMSADTDEDGLSDAYEIHTSKTDPLKSDTDGDGLSDFVEIKAGLNPLSAMSDEKTPDAERNFSISENGDDNKFKIEIKGNADIYNTYCQPMALTGFANQPGVYSEAWEVYHPGELQNVTITFKYNKNIIKNNGLTPENLSIAKWNADGTFTKIESTLEERWLQLTANITENGKYALIAFDQVGATNNVSIFFLMDDSGSMYHKYEIGDNLGADTQFKRLDMAKSIVEHLGNVDTEFGLAKFTKEYFSLAKFGASDEEVLAAIEGMRNNPSEFTGTYIATSIIRATEAFGGDQKDSRKFIFLLTDGATTESTGVLSWNEHDAIKYCNNKNITVIAITLGNDADSSYLHTITEGTGGKYFYANNADALTKIYEAIQAEMKYSTLDIDKDGIIDSYVVADTGFDMDYNAFSFENFTPIVPNDYIQNGVCHGMALFAQAFYRGNNDILTGDSFTMKDKQAGARPKITVPAYDVTNALKGIENLRDYECDIMEKLEFINAAQKDQKYELRDGYPHFKKEFLEQYGDEYLSVRTYPGKGTWKGTSFDKFEILYIDLEKYMAQDVKRDDMEVLTACYWLWATQNATPSGFEKVIYKLNGTGSLPSTEDDFQVIINKMTIGIPLGIGYNLSKDSAHAITAMRMLRDFDDPRVYYLECYDNNTLEEPYLFKIVFSDIGFWNKTTIDHFDDNYSVRPYRLDGETWKETDLRFYEIVQGGEW